MLDRGRQRRGGGDPYGAAGRRAVLAVAVAVTALLMLLALRAGYLAARAIGWPPWPVAAACAVLSLALPAISIWVLSRDR